LNFHEKKLFAYEGGGSTSCNCFEICCSWDYVSEDCQDCYPYGEIHHCDLTGETQGDGCQAICCDYCGAEPRGCYGEAPN